MELFLISIVVWFSALFFLKPNPADLRAKILTRLESFKKIKATYALGMSFIIVFFITSDGTFIKSDDTWLGLLGINNIEKFTLLWFAQTFTSTFVHINFLSHLLPNLVFLGILSFYERGVSTGRFIAVFLFGGVLSSASVLLQSEPMGSVGASGGLCALAGACLLDTPGLRRRDYALGFCLIAFVLLASSFSETKGLNFEVDFWAHALGLIFGALFCKLFPRKKATAS